MYPDDAMTTRRGFFLSTAALLAAPKLLAQPSYALFGKDLIPAPDEPAQWPAFRESLASWRTTTRRRLNYDESLYLRPDFAWVPACFSCYFLMMCDLNFYNPGVGEFRDNLTYWPETGRFDSAVLWHAYPRIGLDDRNQFDFYRDMPGGLKGLRELVKGFHGIKVFLSYNPWDTGTSREPVSDIDALVELVRAIEADGIFLDTMKTGGGAFRAMLDAARPGVVLEGELALPLENIHNHHMSWAQGFEDSRAPGILRNKWFERRHMQHQIHRWRRDHTAELHTAWMNGSGMMVWDNVFGTWAGWNARDRSILRAMLPIQRRYAALFSGEEWTPLVPTLKRDVYASLWEADGLRLWTLVNRAEEFAEGPLLKVDHREGDRYFDLIRGAHVGFDVAGGAVTLRGEIRPRGIGCFLAGSRGALGEDIHRFVDEQARLEGRADFNTALRNPPIFLQKPAATPLHDPDKPPAGMVAIPAAHFRQEVRYRFRECGLYESRDPLFDAPRPPLHQAMRFDREVDLKPYAIDLMPVTNAQYAVFLASSGHEPRHRENFLKHWENGRPPAGKEDHPVVYVDLDDARAYARWAGKRLPTEEEWQYAAQGPEGLTWPWGHDFRAELCNGGQFSGTTAVTAFPDGRSPFGCYDMCGNVWEWTESERRDGRTRFSILKGGSYCEAEGSDWYMDGGPQPPAFAAKFLMMWPGLDRCATVGFRCVVDIR
jgi:formylglycine-generating enzyme required for sulfatase activity